MNIKGNKWVFALAIGVTTATLAGTLYAWDPGINQPGAMGNTGPARRSIRR
jgi:ABC-type branched-subunit amino acid transport system permease subunit